MAIRYRTPFAPEFNFVVKRPMTFNGHAYAPGEEFSKLNVGERMLRRLYDANKIDAVIPSLTIKADHEEPEQEANVAAKPAPEPAAAKPRGRGKRKAEPVEEHAAPAAPAAPRYRLDDGFGFYRIYDGDVIVRECADLEEAKMAMAELSGN